MRGPRPCAKVMMLVSDASSIVEVFGGGGREKQMTESILDWALLVLSLINVTYSFSSPAFSTL